MTNKLRSVIEDQETFVRTVSYQITVEEDNAVPLRLARKALHRLTTGILDAIIEEMEEDPTYLALPANKYEEAFDHGYTHVIHKLKQAREELSTSITQ